MASKPAGKPRKKTMAPDLAALLAHAPASVFLIDVEPGEVFRYRAVSKAFLTRYGLAEDQVVGRTVAEAVHPRSQALLNRQYAEACRTKTTVSWEHCWTDEGAEKCAEIAITPILDENGECGQLVSVATDITERKQAERLYRLLADNVEDVIWTRDLQMRNTWISPSVTRQVGYTVEEAMNLAPADILTPESAQRAVELVGLQNPSARVVLDHKHKNGAIMPIEIHATLLHDENGAPVGILGVSRDVTERRQAEEALRRSEENFRRLFEDALLGLYRTTPDGRILMANPALCRMLGYDSFEDLSKRNLEEDGFPPEYPRSRVKELLDRQGFISGLEARWKRADGSYIFVRESARTQRDGDGRAIYYEGTVEDITELKRAEDALRESEGLLRLVTDALPTLISYVDPDGRYRWLNKAYERWFGISTEAARGRHVHEVLGPAAWETVRPNVERALGGETVFREFALPGPHGADKWVHTAYVPDRDNDGRVRGLVAFAHDLTEHKHAEEELRRHREHLEDLVAQRTAELAERNAALLESERRYRLLADNSEDVIWTMDLDLRVNYVSPSVTRLRGFTVQEAMAQTMAETVTPDSLAVVNAALAEEFEIEKEPEKRPYHSRIMEVEYRCKDGGTVWTEVNAAFLRDERNVACGVIGVTRNITERKRMDREIRRAKETAEEANRAKSTFLASMSHELRTPLNAILGFAEILAGGMTGELTGQQGQYLGNIVTSGKHLLQLISDLLDLARLETGKTKLEPTSIVVEDLLSESVNLFRELAAAKGLTVSSTLSPDVRGRRLWADERRIRQVLWNLLSNAVKFTPVGGAIELRASERNGEIVFAVADTGAGIRPDSLGSVFSGVGQDRRGGQGSPQGAGLGLVISKRLVELHGGSIGVESRGEGAGSTFYFSIPADGGSPAERPPGEPPKPGRVKLKGRVLVVEDDDFSMLMMHDLLKMHGAEVRKAGSAEEALRLVKAERPDVIVMDVGLPQMDGLAATRLLKADPETASIPIIVLTGYAMPTDIEKAREAGCDFYLSKPIDVHKFLENVARATGFGATATAP